uniref:C6 finger domain n=1 Tax=Mycena chlorophos TaxID=658473 RepID=A0ABQ0M2Q3_MYCCL|nr:C6 finger domain [Mycena chlorophos]
MATPGSSHFLLSALFPDAPRQRVPTACVRCRRRKIKCMTSSKDEDCQRCTKKGFKCEYFAVSDPRSSAPAAHASSSSSGDPSSRAESASPSLSSSASLSPVLSGTSLSTPSPTSATTDRDAVHGAPEQPQQPLIWLQTIEFAPPKRPCKQRNHRLAPRQPRPPSSSPPPPAVAHTNARPHAHAPAPAPEPLPLLHSYDETPLLFPEMDHPQALMLPHASAQPSGGGPITATDYLAPPPPTNLQLDLQSLENSLRTLAPERWPPLPNTQWVSDWRLVQAQQHQQQQARFDHGTQSWL